MISLDSINPPDIQENNYLPKTSQNGSESLTVTQTVQLLEIAEDIGAKNNISLINITLPSSSWNVTEIELDFEGIKLKNQTKTIEGNFDSFESLEKDKRIILGQQINITEHTKIFAVHLFGFKLESSPDPAPIYVQINGWNSTHYKPNNTIYGDRTNLTLTELIPGWHVHTFPNPIELYPGKYCLVLNGTDIKDDDRYFLFANLESSLTELYSTKYWNKQGVWDWREVKGQAYMHKFNQWINRSYFPSEINMSVIVDGNPYEIFDENEVGAGNRTITNLDFSPPGDELLIPIENNESLELFFNLTYNIKIKNFLYSEGNVTISDSLYHEWKIAPIINRCTYNYSIRFNFTKSWSHINVKRTGENITDKVIFDKVYHSLLIPNKTIIDGATWLIIANSSNTPFTLDIPEPEYSIGEELEISVNVPDSEGNITCVLTDSSGTEEFRKKKSILTYDVINFSYIIQADDKNGTWSAFLFWNNETDAGFKTQDFQVKGVIGDGGTIIQPGVLSGDNDDDNGATDEMSGILIIVIILLAILAPIGTLSVYQGTKRLKKMREQRRDKLYNKFMDLINLNYIMIAEKKSGLNIYEQYFAGKELDGTLIGGFLNAIRSFGIELSSSYEQSQTISLEYKDLKILMSEFKDFRIIFIMKEKPSEDFLKSATALSYNIENKYGKYVEKFKGGIAIFEGVNKLIETNLNITFISPLKVVEVEGIKLSHSEISMINRAKNIMKQHSLNYFFTRYLMPEQRFDAKQIETIFKLLDKKVFQPTKINFSKE